MFKSIRTNAAWLCALCLAMGGGAGALAATRRPALPEWITADQVIETATVLADGLRASSLVNEPSRPVVLAIPAVVNETHWPLAHPDDLADRLGGAIKLRCGAEFRFVGAQLADSSAAVRRCEIVLLAPEHNADHAVVIALRVPGQSGKAERVVATHEIRTAVSLDRSASPDKLVDTKMPDKPLKPKTVKEPVKPASAVRPKQPKETDAARIVVKQKQETSRKHSRDRDAVRTVTLDDGEVRFLSAETSEQLRVEDSEIERDDDGDIDVRISFVTDEDKYKAGVTVILFDAADRVVRKKKMDVLTFRKDHEKVLKFDGDEAVARFLVLVEDKSD